METLQSLIKIIQEMRHTKLWRTKTFQDILLNKNIKDRSLEKSFHSVVFASFIFTSPQFCSIVSATEDVYSNLSRPHLRYGLKG